MSAFPDRSLQPSGQDGSKDVELWAFEALWSETWASKCDGKKWRFVAGGWPVMRLQSSTVNFNATVIMTHDISWPCHEVIYLCVSNCICITYIYIYILYIYTHTYEYSIIGWSVSCADLLYHCRRRDQLANVHWGPETRMYFSSYTEQEPPSCLKVLRWHVNSSLNLQGAHLGKCLFEIFLVCSRPNFMQCPCPQLIPWDWVGRKGSFWRMVRSSMSKRSLDYGCECARRWVEPHWYCRTVGGTVEKIQNPVCG